MRTLKSLGSAMLAVVLMVGAVATGPVRAAVAVNGVSYDHVGIVTKIDGSTITIDGRTFSLGISGNVRRDKSTVPLSTVQPGTYVGVRLQPSTRGLPIVTELTILPQ